MTLKKAVKSPVVLGAAGVFLAGWALYYGGRLPGITQARMGLKGEFQERSFLERLFPGGN